MQPLTAEIIFPSSSISTEQSLRIPENLRALNMQFNNPDIPEKYGYLAGTDEVRFSSLIAGFSSPSDVVWCARGGYGAARLLPFLHQSFQPAQPKIWLGYSDNTALLLFLGKLANQMAVHASVPAENWSAETLHYLNQFFSGSPVLAYSFDEIQARTGHQTTVLKPGKANGPLTGGNLSILASLCGTPWQPVFKDKLVLIEEVGEKPYKVDRMLHQLWQATDISRAAGFIFGTFQGCETPPGGGHIPLETSILNLTEPLGVPVIFNFPSGHGAWQVPLPLEQTAELDTHSRTLIYRDLKFNYTNG
jgi:muramoyltetrapeptide carboxypeptidase